MDPRYDAARATDQSKGRGYSIPPAEPDYRVPVLIIFFAGLLIAGCLISAVGGMV